MPRTGDSESAQFASQRGLGLYRLAYAVTGDTEAAAKATYAALDRLSRRWGSITAEGSPGAAARQFLVAALRPGRRAPEDAYGLATLPTMDDFAEAPVDDDATRLFAGYAAAPRETRVYLALGALEDLDQAEVASTSGVPTENVIRAVGDFWSGIEADGRRDWGALGQGEQLRRVLHRISDGAPTMPPAQPAGWVRRHTGRLAGSGAAVAVAALVGVVATQVGASPARTPQVTFSSVPRPPAVGVITNGVPGTDGPSSWSARGPLVGDPRVRQMITSTVLAADGSPCLPTNPANPTSPANPITAQLYYAGMVGELLTVVFGCPWTTADGIPTPQVVVAWASPTDPRTVSSRVTSMPPSSRGAGVSGILAVQPGQSVHGPVLVLTDPTTPTFDLAKTVSVDRAGRTTWRWTRQDAPGGVKVLAATGGAVAWRLRESARSEPVRLLGIPGAPIGQIPLLDDLSGPRVATFDRHFTDQVAQYVAQVTGTPITRVRMHAVVRVTRPILGFGPGEDAPVSRPVSHVLMVAAELPSGGQVRATVLAVPELGQVTMLEGGVPMSADQITRTPAVDLGFRSDSGPGIVVVIAPRGSKARVTFSDGRTSSSAPITDQVASWQVDGVANSGPLAPALTVLGTNGSVLHSGPVYPSTVNDFPGFQDW